MLGAVIVVAAFGLFIFVRTRRIAGVHVWLVAALGIGALLGWDGRRASNSVLLALVPPSLVLLAVRWRAQRLIREGRPDQAAGPIRVLVALSGSPDDRHALVWTHAQHLFDADRGEEALGLLRRHAPTSWAARSMLMRYERKWTELRDLDLTGLKLAEQARLHTWRLMAFGELGDTDGLLRAYAALPDLGSSRGHPEQWRLAAAAYLGRVAEVERLASSRRRGSPGWVAAWLGRAEFASGDPDAAHRRLAASDTRFARELRDYPVPPAQTDDLSPEALRGLERLERDLRSST